MAYDVYPYTNLHNLNLDWMLSELKRIAAESASTADAQEALKAYVESKIDDIPVTVRAELQRMADDGTLLELLGGGVATMLTNRKGRRWLFVGDSYANRTGDWDDRLVAWWGLDRYDLTNPPKDSTTGEIIPYTGQEDCYAIRWGGYGFLGVVTSNPDLGGRWLDLCLEHFPADLDKNTFTDIVIVGGYNDRIDHTETQIFEAMRDFRREFTTRFHNAHVWLAEVGMHSTNRLDRNRLVTVYNAYKRAAEVGPRWSFIAGADSVLHFARSLDSRDHHHPTAAGGYDLGLFISEALMHDSHVALVKGPLTVSFDESITAPVALRTRFYTDVDPWTHTAKLFFPYPPSIRFASADARPSLGTVFTIGILQDTAVLPSTRMLRVIERVILSDTEQGVASINDARPIEFTVSYTGDTEDATGEFVLQARVPTLYQDEPGKVVGFDMPDNIIDTIFEAVE